MSAPEFFVMLHGAYTRVPYAGTRGSNFVDLSNDEYDRVEGQRIMERQLRLFVDLEEMGYDGGVISEQHNGPIGLFGNPSVGGAWVASRTSTLKIGVVGPILNAYTTPVKLAEEIAALDILSRGRVVMGLPLGHGNQYQSLGVMNPATARARYHEAHDLLVKAFTHPGPFEWIGEHFQIPYVNLWPKPLQDPHPEVVILGGGSKETIEMVVENRYGFSSIGSRTLGQAADSAASFRALCLEHGYEAERRQVWSMIGIHVAETDEIAREEHEASILWNAQNFFQANFYDSFPPGYMSAASMRGVLGGGYRGSDSNVSLFDQTVGGGLTIVGSPETVAEKLAIVIDTLDPGRVIFDPLVDSKPDWIARKSLNLLAEEVLPRFRGGDGAPAERRSGFAGYQSLSEYRSHRADSPAPLVNLDGDIIETESAHRPELRTPLGTWPPA